MMHMADHEHCQFIVQDKHLVLIWILEVIQTICWSIVCVVITRLPGHEKYRNGYNG